jgi:hypothetical protein
VAIGHSTADGICHSAVLSPHRASSSPSENKKVGLEIRALYDEEKWFLVQRDHRAL